MSRASPFVRAFGGEVRGGRIAKRLKALRLKAQAVIMTRSFIRKITRFSKDNTLPFMLFVMLGGTSLCGGWHRGKLGMEAVAAYPVFSTKIPASKTPNAILGQSNDASRVFRTAIFFADGLLRCFRR